MQRLLKKGVTTDMQPRNLAQQQLNNVPAVSPAANSAVSTSPMPPVTSRWCIFGRARALWRAGAVRPCPHGHASGFLLYMFWTT